MMRLKTEHNLINLQKELDKWDDLNLYVHNTKTEAILINRSKPKLLKYPICENYKYLGIPITNNKNQFTKTKILENIRKFENQMKYFSIKMGSLKIGKFTITWWLLSKLLYCQISNLFLEYIKIPEFVGATIRKIKSILLIKKYVPQNFVMNLLNINLTKMIEQMLANMKNNCPIPHLKMNEQQKLIKIWDKLYLSEFKFWNYVITGVDVNINSFYSVCARFWWCKNLGPYICKECNKPLSLFHLNDFHKEKYPLLLEDGCKWILELDKNYDFKKGLIQRNIPQEKARLFFQNAINISYQIKEKAISELGMEPIPKKAKTQKHKLISKITMSNTARTIPKKKIKDSTKKDTKDINIRESDEYSAHKENKSTNKYAESPQIYGQSINEVKSKLDEDEKTIEENTKKAKKSKRKIKKEGKKEKKKNKNKKL